MKAGAIFAGVVGVIALGVFVSFLLSWPVMALWNGCLVPAVNGANEISWLQAWGLSILCSFLFKSHISNSK